MPLDIALPLPEGKSWHPPINMASRVSIVSTACSIFVSQIGQAVLVFPCLFLLSSKKLPLDLVLPEGKSLRAPSLILDLVIGQ